MKKNRVKPSANNNQKPILCMHRTPILFSFTHLQKQQKKHPPARKRCHVTHHLICIHLPIRVSPVASFHGRSPGSKYKRSIAPFPFSISAENSGSIRRCHSLLQWRDRVGFSPNFPFKPFGAPPNGTTEPHIQLSIKNGSQQALSILYQA